MQNLTPVGLSQDGKRLILVSPAGEEFAVPVDTRLRAALRGENSRLVQLEMKMESALRPRDIQARIRAGESAEEVATAAQTTVEAIMAFATPVLAERAHVARTAQRASVRRRSGDSSSAGRTLGEAAELYFSEHSLHDEDVEWDAWRGPDGRWVLVAKYALAGRARTAEFTHDLPGRYVVAENDEARFLTGELHAPEARGAGTAARTPTRRLGAVPSQDELPLGDDAIELVRDRDETPATGPSPDASSLDSLPEQPAREIVTDLVADPAAETADADWMVGSEPGDREPRAPELPTATAPEAEPVVGSASATPQEEHERESEPATETAATTEPATGPATEKKNATESSKKRSRSSVPSWDEIMFGGKND